MLNLNKLFQTSVHSLTSLVITLSAEYESLGNYVEEYLIASLNEINKTIFYADRYFSFDSVKEIFVSSSLFGGDNLVIVKFKTKPTVEQSKQLIELMNLANVENRLFLICDKLDKKDLAGSWVGLFDEVLAISGDISESRVWVNHMLKASELTISDAAFELLLNLNQNNYTQLRQEVNKFTFLYPAGYDINYQDAMEQLTDNAQFNVFALSNAYLVGDLELSTKIFNNVCVDSENIILLIWLIAEDLRKLIQIKNAVKNGQSVQSVMPALRIWGDAVSSFQIANQRISYTLLLELLNEVAQVDIAVKGLSTEKPMFLLEKIIAKFCGEKAC